VSIHFDQSLGGGGDARLDTGWQPTATNISAGTYLMWVRIDSRVQPSMLAEVNQNVGSHYIASFGVTPTPRFEWKCHRATTQPEVTASHANFALFRVGVPLFVAMSYDISLAATEQYWLCGDEYNLAREPSSYSARTVGSGTVDATTANLYVGNRSAFDLATLGAITKFARLPVHISIADALKFQSNDNWDDTADVWYDLHSTSHLTDLSGNGRNGTMGGTDYGNDDDAALGTRMGRTGWTRR